MSTNDSNLVKWEREAGTVARYAKAEIATIGSVSAALLAAGVFGDTQVAHVLAFIVAFAAALGVAVTPNGQSAEVASLKNTNRALLATRSPFEAQNRKPFDDDGNPAAPHRLVDGPSPLPPTNDFPPRQGPAEES